MNKETPTVKEKAIYQAVVDLFMEGADLSGLTVSEITAKAGIGKGTAYGYFSDKEDMIARSICYNVDQYCHWIYQGITEQKTLYEKIDFLLGKMEKEISKADCLMRLSNTMSMDSVIGKRIRQQEVENNSKNPPLELLEAVFEAEHFTPPLSEEMLQFLARNALSRIFCYGMMLSNNSVRAQKMAPAQKTAAEQEAEMQAMHRLVCRASAVMQMPSDTGFLRREADRHFPVHIFTKKLLTSNDD